MHKIAIFTGGTLGHIKPSLEIAQELRKRGNEVDFFVNKSADEEKISIIRKNNFNIIKIQSGYFRMGFNALLLPFRLISGFLDSFNILRNRNYDKIIGMGSYASLPGVLAARLLGKNIYLCEQNVSPGRANRLLSRFADMIFLGFEESRKYFPKYLSKLRVYGNPVDKKLFQIKKNGTRKKLLIFGGTNGAKDINEFIAINADKLLKNIGIVHITRKLDFDRINKLYGKNIRNKRLKLISYSDDITMFYNDANIVICRTGAGSLFEVFASGCKAIFVPHPNSLDDHQIEYAEIARKLGYSVLKSREL